MVAGSAAVRRHTAQPQPGLFNQEAFGLARQFAKALSAIVGELEKLVH